MLALSSQKEEYVKSGPAVSAEVLQGLPSYAYAQCCMVHINYLLKDLSGLLPALSSRGDFRREGTTNRAPSFFGPQTCMVHVDVRHTCVFHSVQTRLVCYRRLLAMEVWPGQHGLLQGCPGCRKLLHEGKTAATRARSCGHHDSLQFFILFSLLGR